MWSFEASYPRLWAYSFALLIFLGCLSIDKESSGWQEPYDPDTRTGVYDALLQEAVLTGQVPIIVGLKVPFVPEGKLRNPVLVKKQRRRISKAQDRLIRRLGLPSLGRRNGLSARKIDYIPYIAMRVDERTLKQIASLKGVANIEIDLELAPLLASSTALIEAPDAWQAGGSGAGQVIAIIDTGVDGSHPFLTGKVVAEACFSSNLCPSAQVVEIGSGAAVPCPAGVDGCDHGTLVAGIGAGRGATFSGVARDAQIIAVQAAHQQSTPAACDPDPAPCARFAVSNMLSALMHVHNLHTSSGMAIAAVNMSLGSGEHAQACDSATSLKAAIDNLRSVGIATVVAAGNDGFSDSLSFPACISSAISVGSTTKADKVSGFSNRPDASLLDFFAPGTAIVTSSPGGSFRSAQGTSMAAPHVAGGWAVLKSKLPSATVDELESLLKKTGKPINRAYAFPVSPPPSYVPRIDLFHEQVNRADVVPSSRTYGTYTLGFGYLGQGFLGVSKYRKIYSGPSAIGFAHFSVHKWPFQIFGLVPRSAFFHTSVINGFDNGLFGVDSSGALINAFWASRDWRFRSVHAPELARVVPSSLIAVDNHEGGRIYGVNQAGRIFATWINEFNQMKFGDLNYRRDRAPIVPGSLAWGFRMRSTWGVGEGVYGVDTQGKVVLIQWPSNNIVEGPWFYRAIDSQDVVKVAPGSLLSLELAQGWGKVYGIDDQGRVFETRNPNPEFTIPTLAVLPGQGGMRRLEPSSLVWAFQNGLFAVDDQGNLVNGRPQGNSWSFQVIASWVGKVQPGSLFAVDNHEGGRVYGVDEQGRIVGTWVNNANEIVLALLHGQEGMNPVLPGSLVHGFDWGLFGVDSHGQLVHGFWSAGDWHFRVIPSWDGPVEPGSLISVDNQEGGRVYGVTRNNRVFNSWVNHQNELVLVEL